MAGRKTFRKVITSEELIKQINPKNTDLVERFLRNMSTKRSPKTIVVYRSNYNIFFVWNLLYNENKFITEIKKFELMDFFDFCVMDLQWKSNRFAQMHSSLSSLYTWIENTYDERYPNLRNIVMKIEKPPKEVTRKKSIFTKEELNSLLNWLGEIQKPQEQCLLALMMGSGSRASELVRFTTTHIDEKCTAFEDLFLETTDDIKVKGRGVSGKMVKRYIIKDIFLPYYKMWLPIRKEIMKEKNQEHDYIFIKPDGTPATESTIRSWVEKWDKALDKHFYIHSIRHFWCTYLLSIGLEKELVQELQSWSSDTLVNIYNDSTAKDRKWKGLSKLKAELEKASFAEELDNIEKEIV